MVGDRFQGKCFPQCVYNEWTDINKTFRPCCSLELLLDEKYSGPTVVGPTLLIVAITTTRSDE